jgi:anti-sigma factor RsiW
MHTQSVLTILFAFLLVSTTVLANDASLNDGELSQDNRAKLLTLLSQDCFVAAEEAQWHKAIAELPHPAAEKILMKVIVQGAPNAIRLDTQQAAKSRYHRRNRYLQSDTGKAIENQTRQTLLAIDEMTYVNAALESVDLTFRENALLALGIIGTPASISALTAANLQTPSLQPLLKQTIQQLRDRKRQ